MKQRPGSDEPAASRQPPAPPWDHGPGIAVGPGRNNEPAADRDALDALRADAARRRYLVEGPEELPIPEPLKPFLAEGERLVATHRAVEVDGSNLCAGAAAVCDLFVTSRRLLQLEPEHFEVRLDEITEAAIGHNQLLLMLRCGRYVRIRTDQPRLLRVQIAFGRAPGKAAPESSQLRAR
jgi:hypothetical protein